MPIDRTLKIPDNHPIKGGIFFGVKPPPGWKPRSAQASNPEEQVPPAPPASSSRVPLTMEEQKRNLEEWMNKGIYEAAAHQMSTDLPSEPTAGEKPDAE